MRSLASIGRRELLLLLEAALNADEEAPVSDAGAAAEASVPGISFCAIAAEANMKNAQLSL
jgi:hypothetical protein